MRKLDGIVSVWSLKTFRQEGFFRPHARNPVDARGFARRALVAVELSRDEEWLVTGGDDGMVRIWEMKSLTTTASPKPSP